MKTMRVVLSVAGCVGVIGAAGEAVADDFMTTAKAEIAAAASPYKTWDGPTTGPKAVAGKTVAFVASDLTNGGVNGVSAGVSEAAKVMGWTVRVIDGQGSVAGRTAALNQAIALKPDGIILGGFDAVEQKPGLEQARSLKLPVVSWHAAAKAGPDDSIGLFTNVSTDALKVARLAALYAVVKSDGKAGVVVFTDSAFSVAIAKSDAMARTVKECPGCQVLSVEDTPLADTSNRMPQLTTSLLQRYGAKWTWSLGINDLYFDFMPPALAAAGISGDGPPANVSAGDGSESAYQRVRDHEFQAATVPEPLSMEGWQLVDELNRAFAGVAWSGFVPPVHLVTADTIAFDGGPKNIFDPDNGYRDQYRHIWGK